MSRTDATETGGRVSVASAIWIMAGVVAVLCVTIGPFIKDAIAVGQLSSPTRNDAALGTVVELPEHDYLGRPFDTQARTLLVVGGACTGCSVTAIKPGDAEGSPFPQVAFVYLASDEQIVSQFGIKRSRALIFGDKFGKVADRLGATTAPRYYVIERGVLKEVWTDVKTKPTEWLGSSR